MASGRALSWTPQHKKDKANYIGSQGETPCLPASGGLVAVTHTDSLTHIQAQTGKGTAQTDRAPTHIQTFKKTHLHTIKKLNILQGKSGSSSKGKRCKRNKIHERNLKTDFKDTCPTLLQNLVLVIIELKALANSYKTHSEVRKHTHAVCRQIHTYRFHKYSFGSIMKQFFIFIYNLF